MFSDQNSKFNFEILNLKFQILKLNSIKIN